MGTSSNRTKNGKPIYGFVFSIPPEIEITHLAPSNGIHLVAGEPVKGLIAFMSIHGIDALHKFVAAKNDSQITAVKMEPWNAKTCEVQTPDGYRLRFFEEQKDT